MKADEIMRHIDRILAENRTALKRVKELEHALQLIKSAEEASENPLDLIQNICDEFLNK